MAQEVLSTGLFVLQPSQLSQQQVPLITPSYFSADAFNISAISTYPLQAYEGIRKYNLSYPKGVTSDLVMQDFKPISTSTKYSTITAHVPGFKPNFHCETVTPSHLDFFQSEPWQAPEFLATIATNSCRLEKLVIAKGPSGNDFLWTNISQTYQGFWHNATCNDTGESRTLVSVADLRWTVPPPEPVNGYPGSPGLSGMPGMSTAPHNNYTVSNLTAVLCKSSYSVDRYAVSFRGHGSAMSAEVINGTASRLNNLTDADISNALRFAGSDANQTLWLTDSSEDFAKEPLDPYFLLMMATNNLSDLFTFLEPKILEATARDTLSGVSTLIAHEYLMQPSDKDSVIYGSMVYVEQRLIAEDLTVYLILGTLALLSIVALLEVFICPKSNAPCALGSISSLATIIAASDVINKQLAGLGRLEKSEALEVLAKNRYKTIMERQFLIENTFKMPQPVGMTRTLNGERNRPIKARSCIIAMTTTILPILLIVLLEILQQVSDSNNGIIELNPSRLSQVMISCIPTLTMVPITILYAGLNFDTAMLTPFRALRTGNATSSRSVNLNLIGEFPLHAVWLSARNYQLIPCLTLLAALVSSFLSILISGLYSISSISSTSPIDLRQTSDFNFTRNDLSRFDNDAAAITSLLEYSDLPYPQWTYGVLALPDFQLDRPQKNPGIVSIDIQIPAFRPRLACSVVPQSLNQAFISKKDARNFSDYTLGPHLWLELGANLSCVKDESDTWTPNSTWIENFWIDTDNRYYSIGHASNLEFSADRAFDGTTHAAAFDGYGSEYSPRCPPIAFILGKAKAFKVPNSARGFHYDIAAHINVIACFPRTDALTVEVQLEMPDLTINTEKPPTILANTSQPIEGGPNGHWHYSLEHIMLGLTSPQPPSSQNRFVDQFTDALARGKSGGISYAQWGDNSSHTHESLIRALDHLYATYMVQAVSQTMRVRLEPNSADPNNATFSKHKSSSHSLIFTGTANSPQNRLKQNAASKIALQGVLGFMVLCASITYAVQLWEWKKNRKGYVAMPPMLREIPCSIAATATLLAGSEMVGRKYVPEGTEWERDKTGIWNGLRFRMGWWDVEEEAKEEGAGVENGSESGEMGRRERKKMRFGIDVERKKERNKTNLTQVPQS